MTTPDEKPLVGTKPSVPALTVPEKAALPHVTPVCTTPNNESARSSAEFTPRTDKSGNPFETDLEAMISTTTSRPGCARRVSTHQRDDCQVWPGRAEWKQQAKAAKARRQFRFNCLAGLGRRNRIIAKVLIVLLIVGIACGVGFGVSKHLGAPIWGDD